MQPVSGRHTVDPRPLGVDSGSTTFEKRWYPARSYGLNHLAVSLSKGKQLLELSAMLSIKRTVIYIFKKCWMCSKNCLHHLIAVLNLTVVSPEIFLVYVASVTASDLNNVCESESYWE